ncbi:MAG: hypothetical protein IJA07_05830 [Agathobacter sp.]|nr:hypothetical protein [Agathobacter sp.]
MGCTNALLSSLKDKKLTNETVSTINLFTGSDIKLNEEGEGTDVCQVIEEIKKEAAEEAVAEVRAEMKKKADERLAKNVADSVEKLMRNFSLSVEDACRGLEYSVEVYEKAKKLCVEK